MMKLTLKSSQSLYDTVKPDFSKLFERRKNVYYCQVFTIYHVIYAVIANFGKQQKVYLQLKFTI